MSRINPNDHRRYRMRSTGIVYRVIGERRDEMDFAPVCGGVALEIKRNVVDETFARCDLIDPKSPTCKECGGEKFTLYGGVTVCVYCASRPVDSTLHEPVADTDSEAFVRHLERTTEEFRAWPDWKRGVAARLFGITPDELLSRRHALIADVSVAVDDLLDDVSQRTQAAKVVAKLQKALPEDTGSAPPFWFRESGDGSIGIEWLLPKCRVSFVIERDPSESSWHVVAVNSRREIDTFNCGALEDADVPWLISCGLRSLETR